MKIQDYIRNNPTIGVVIPGLNGARKIRFKLSNNKGKSGGGRIIYINILKNSKIYLLDVYSKSDK